MPAFAYERLEAGEEMTGLVVVNDRAVIGRVIADLPGPLDQNARSSRHSLLSPGRGRHFANPLQIAGKLPLQFLTACKLRGVADTVQQSDLESLPV